MADTQIHRSDYSFLNTGSMGATCIRDWCSALGEMFRSSVLPLNAFRLSTLVYHFSFNSLFKQLLFEHVGHSALSFQVCLHGIGFFCFQIWALTWRSFCTRHLNWKKNNKKNTATRFLMTKFLGPSAAPLKLNSILLWKSYLLHGLFNFNFNSFIAMFYNHFF